MTDIRHQLADHLRFYDELGVAGISRDPKWRTRAVHAAIAAPPTAPAQAVSSDPVSSDPGSPSAASDSTLMQIARSPQDALDRLRTEIGPDCARCKLHRLGRRQVVFGVGNPDADLMFVGEAPGADEDVQGIPFVGRAGQLLTKMINAIQLERDQVYIANVIKCRPPGNRNPERDEIETCQPFLFRQIEAIRPKVIVALGTFAAQTLLQSTESISRLRGRVYEFRGATLVPTFHPSFLLRSPDRKRDAWEDLKKARAILQGADE